MTTPSVSGGTGEVLRATIYARVRHAGAAVPDRVAVTYTNDPNNGGEASTFGSDA